MPIMPAKKHTFALFKALQQLMQEEACPKLFNKQKTVDPVKIEAESTKIHSRKDKCA